MSSETARSAFAVNMQEAEEELARALERFARSLSQEVDSCLEDAVRRRREENAFRLKVVLQSLVPKIEGAIVNGSQQQRPLVVEDGGAHKSYWWKDPQTGATMVSQYHFQEPDEHYLGLLRRALGPKFRVWLAWFRCPWGPSWRIYAKYVDWPREHHPPRRRVEAAGRGRLR